MKLRFRQRFVSWTDSYDIWDEQGNMAYTIKGELAWGHCFQVYDKEGRPVGRLKEDILAFGSKFDLYLGNDYAGCIRRKFVAVKPQFLVEYNGWHVKGTFSALNYQILNTNNIPVATIHKEFFRMTDTYVIDVQRPEDALMALMVVLAIDADACSNEIRKKAIAQRKK